MIKMNTSYTDYCNAFKNGDSSAKMVFELRNWLVKEYIHITNTSNGNNFIGLDDLEPIKSLDMEYDMLSNIVRESIDSFFRIFDRMREKNSRENVVMPVQNAKEINSSSIIWLCRQPGRNAREKIGNANNKIMAVRRFVSNDTPENRLLIACAKLLSKRIQEKVNLIGDNYCSNEELTFLSRTASFLHSDEAMAISDWNNTPPNNALLSDRNYKKIWNAWTCLKELDSLVKRDFENIVDNSFTLFKVELLANLKKIFFLPQIPIVIDYTQFRVDFKRSVIHGCDKEKNPIKICIYSDVVEILYKSKNIRFKNNVLLEYDFYGENKVSDIIKCIIKNAGIEEEDIIIRNETQSINYTEKKYIDIISAIPVLASSSYEIYNYKPKMIYQEFLSEEHDEKYLMSCYKSDVLIVDNSTITFTIKSAAEQERIDVLQKIFVNIKKTVNSNSLTMLINDGYDAFQLKNYKKSARSSFSNAELFPESIGTAFWYQYFSEDFTNYRTGDLIIVANLIGSNYSLTPLSSVYADDAKNDFIWERYPTRITNTRVFEILKENLEKVGCASNKAMEILNASGLKSLYAASSDIFFDFEDCDTQSLEQYLHNLDDIIKVDITKNADRIIDDMLSQNDSIHNAHIIILSNIIEYNGKYNYINAETNDIIKGAIKHDALYSEMNSNIAASSHKSLWRDHLPDLAIQQLIGSFPLIKNAKTSPVLGKKQKIEIKSVFTLPAKKKEYHFKLIQNDNGSDLRYEAVIRNEAFPLERDTKCHLNMYYQYDAEDVYSLEFVPVEPLEAEFIKAKVQFEKSSDEEYNDLPIPNFPEPAKWEDLYSYTTEHDKKVDLIAKLKSRFKTIESGYHTIDFTNEKYSSKGGRCERSIDGEDVIIRWGENSWDKNEERRPEYLGIVTCFLKPLPVARRHSINLNKNAKYGQLWHCNSIGQFQCNRYFEYEGEWEKITFFSSEFDKSSEFSPEISNISFEIIRKKDGTLKAINIHDEDKGSYVQKKTFHLEKMKNGKDVPHVLFEKELYFALYNTFSSSNNRSFMDEDCPEDLRSAFENSKSNWFRFFHSAHEKKTKRRILLGMSLMAHDFGEEFYDILNESIDAYKRKEIKLPDESGCALGDLTQDCEKNLLNHMLAVLPDEKMMAILSKGLWNNERLVYNIDVGILFKYLSTAYERLKTGIETFDTNKKETEYKKLADMSVCLEYILAVLRLRENKDEEFNKHYLSLNNSTLENIYKILEQMALDKKKFCKIKSYIRVQITNKGSYDYVPDIIYTLLVYISGQSSDNDIRISGVVMSEED